MSSSAKTSLRYSGTVCTLASLPAHAEKPRQTVAGACGPNRRSRLASLYHGREPTLRLAKRGPCLPRGLQSNAGTWSIEIVTVLCVYRRILSSHLTQILLSRSESLLTEKARGFFSRV